MGDAELPGTVVTPEGEAMAFGTAIDALRERGAQRVDPVRFRFIESLARRAATHEGAARRILDSRLAQLLSAFGDDLDKAMSLNGDAEPLAEQAPPSRGALAELLDHLARRAKAPALGVSAKAVSPGVGARAELESLPYFRRTWSRLSTEQRLAQSLSALPQNAGPLNSHQLVHRALTLMRDLSPEYIERFIPYVDALLWLDLVKDSGGREASPVSRADGDKKVGRGRSG
jgi:hypothetical protein